jgi:hypothetical protein
MSNKNQDPLAGLKAATEGLSKKTPKEEAKAIIKNALVFLLDLSPLELEEAFDYLKGLCTLPNSYWSALKKEVRARKDSKQKQKVQLSQLEEVRRLHPAIDFKDGHMTLGLRVDLKDGEGILLLVSDGQTVKSEILYAPVQGQAPIDNGIELAGNNYVLSGKGTPPILQDIWDLGKVRAFLENPTRPNALYVQIKDTLRRFLDLPEPVYGLLAGWIVMTYFTHLFGAVPFLHFIGPKETGKSKTLEALRFSCFNAWKGRDISAAALGDTVDGQRGVVLFDQAERLGEKDEGITNLVGLIADSYKKAGGNRRIVEMSKTGRRVLEFSTYGPKAFASTKPIDPDLRDRCVRVPMTRTRLPLPDLEGYEPEWLDLRDACYRFALLVFLQVVKAYSLTPGDGTRVTELWRPLETVLSVLGVDQEEVKGIRDFYLSQNQETRHEPTTWEVTLLEVLKEKAGTQDKTFEMNSQEILEAMKIEGEVKPGAPWLGNALSTYNLYQKAKRKWEGGRYLRNYTFEPERVKNLCEIYLDTPPQNPGSTGLCHGNIDKTNGYDEPTQNHEPVSPGLFGQNEPTHTGSPKQPGSMQLIENISKSVSEPTQPAFRGGMAEKKRTFRKVQCRTCSKIANPSDDHGWCTDSPDGTKSKMLDEWRDCENYDPKQGELAWNE